MSDKPESKATVKIAVKVKLCVTVCDVPNGSPSSAIFVPTGSRMSRIPSPTPKMPNNKSIKPKAKLTHLIV